MKKQIIIITALLCLAILLGGCETLGGNETVPSEQEDSAEIKTEITATTTTPTETATTPVAPAETTTPSPSPTTSPSPTDAPPEETTPAPKVETSYAFIVKWGERMDPETDFAFDYVDWFFGDEAITIYMQDNGISWEEAEASIEEAGYIRNVNPMLRWFTTTPESEYYMPDEFMSVTPVKVGYDDFRNIMIPAIEENNMALTFVKITSSGESILKIEWVFRP